MKATGFRLAIVATHPIQHFVPFYRALAQEANLDVHVFFCARIGVNQYFDDEMNTHVQWNMDLTSGYAHSFLPEADEIERVGFRDVNNPSIGRYLSQFRPDAVVIYGYANLTALRTIAWALVRGTPALMISDSEPLHRRSALARTVKQIALRPLAATIAGFLTVGDNNERYWRQYGVSSRRIFRTPFSIDEQQYLDVRQRRTALRKDWRRDLGISQDEVLFLSVGKLSERKRQRDMIAALAQAQRIAIRPLRLVLAGDGDQRADLEALAREMGAPATFLGFVNLDKLPAAYAAADVLLHASSIDAHPLVFSEAACVGLPIVASDRIGAVGPTDIARPGVNACIFPVGNIDALARIIVELADDPARRKVMGAASLEVFASQDMESSVAGLRRALTAAVGAR